MADALDSRTVKEEKSTKKRVEEKGKRREEDRSGAARTRDMEDADAECGESDCAGWKSFPWHPGMVDQRLDRTAHKRSGGEVRRPSSNFDTGSARVLDFASARAQRYIGSLAPVALPSVRLPTVPLLDAFL